MLFYLLVRLGLKVIKEVEEEYDRLLRHAAKGLKNLLHLGGSKYSITHKTNSGDQSRLNTSF